jgi:hypothetical protein
VGQVPERMILMNELNTTTKLVKTILEEDKQARNSDSFLYLKVIETIAEQKGINLYGISIPIFLVSMKENGFPGFETVRRTRQKVQQHHPELVACDKVKGMRMVNETEFRRYARGEV